MEQAEAEAVPGGKPNLERPGAENAGSAAEERAQQTGKSDRMPADLAELATLWDHLPRAIRQSWLLTAKALVKGRA